MARSILDYPPSTVYHPKSHRCENCLYWTGDPNHKMFAKVGNDHIWVGQCVALEERGDAPYSDLDNGVEAFVFTPPQGRCLCFAMHPDAAQAEAAAREILASILNPQDLQPAAVM